MSNSASVAGMPPSSRASTAGDHQAVWGSQIEQSQAAMLDTLLSMIPSVVFARATTFILGAAGYQVQQLYRAAANALVLDSPATSALKAACEDKPKAASVTLVCARFSKMTGWGGRGVEDSVEREWSGGRRKRPQHDDAVIVWQGTKSSDPWILTGPTAFSGKDFSRMVRAELYPLPLHSISCA
eukprot:2150593-Rhodomonas_salina.2